MEKVWMASRRDVRRAGPLYVEAIAHAVDGMDDFGLRHHRRDLPAQVLDMAVDRPVIDIEAVSPRQVQQLRPRIDRSWTLGHGDEQIVLGRRQLQWLTAQAYRSRPL